MKRYLEIFSLVFLALLIGVGSSGISVNKMTCFTSGKVVRSLEKEFCCTGNDMPTENAVLSSSCCDYQETDFKVNNFLVNNTLVQFGAPLVATVCFAIPMPQFEFLSQRWIFEIPPLPSTERLAKLCKLLI
jgi:hypothetical protein